MAILEVKALETHFRTRRGVIKAANNVSLALEPGHILGLVGESGAGKTVLALSILNLVPFPGKIVGGDVLFQGRSLLRLTARELRTIRGKEISMISQDPVRGLNPVMSIGPQVEETLTSHLRISKREARQRALALLRQMGLPDPERVAAAYPYQLSGGMCQRVMLAIAMALKPQVLIADEPTSALDVTIQAEILSEIRRLKEDCDAAVLFISHDLGVIAQMADEVAVMYAGSIVERAPTAELFRRPVHPYTWGLLRSLPRLDQQRQEQLPTIRGAPPSLLNLPDECPFLPRCHKAITRCRTSSNPLLHPVGARQEVACYNPVVYDWAPDGPT
ncbi:MAG: ABC transporter ATP-binding protein [Chloroflexi bacterium]|nr:ABC transporter ATP-binding protein [Chloroflexota bacterium]